MIRFAAAVLALAVAGPVPAHAGFLRKKDKLKANPDGVVIPPKSMEGRIKKTPKPDTRGDLSFLKEDEKVAAPFFRVRFITNTKAASTSKSGGLPSESVSATKIVETELAGIDDKTWQEIADLAYADFVSKAKAAGINLLTAADVASTKYFSEKMDDKYPDHNSGNAVFVPADAKWGGVFKLPKGMAHMMNEAQAGVMSVDLTLNFVAYGVSDEGDLTDARAEVSYGQVAHAGGKISAMRFKDSKCNFMGCAPSRKGTGEMVLNQVTYSGKPFGSFSDTTSGGTKVANAIALLGKSSKRSKSQKTFTADPEKYKEAALEALYEANTRLLSGYKG